MGPIPLIQKNAYIVTNTFSKTTETHVVLGTFPVGSSLSEAYETNVGKGAEPRKTRTEYTKDVFSCGTAGDYIAPQVRGIVKTSCYCSAMARTLSFPYSKGITTYALNQLLYLCTYNHFVYQHMITHVHDRLEPRVELQNEESISKGPRKYLFDLTTTKVKFVCEHLFFLVRIQLFVKLKIKVQIWRVPKIRRF